MDTTLFREAIQSLAYDELVGIINACNSMIESIDALDEYTNDTLHERSVVNAIRIEAMQECGSL